MDNRTIQTKEFALAARAYREARAQAAAARTGGSLSRRQFLKTAGAAVLGSTLIPSLLQTGMVAASGPGDPVPIPGGTPVLGGGFHLFGPVLSIRTMRNQSPSPTSMVPLASPSSAAWSPARTPSPTKCDHSPSALRICVS